MPSVTDLAFPDLEHELASTRRILERVPDGQFAWKPHDKSMSLGRLASHVASLSAFAAMMVSQPDVDLMEGKHTAPPDVATTDDLLARFDETSGMLRRALAGASDEKLLEHWRITFGPRVIYDGPRYKAVRQLGISHLVHHRGQLGVYLRLLNTPVPGLYGPSADEQP